MSTPGPQDDGVLDSSYAAARAAHPALRFRLRTRALLAYRACREFAPALSAPVLVDLGAAEGLTLLELAGRFAFRGTFIGVEYAQDLIRSAAALPANVRLLQGDAAALPQELDDASCDVVTALAVLEHLASPLRAVREAHRILKPGGLLIVTCPNPGWDRLAVALGLLEGGQHQTDFTGIALRRLMQEGGFSVVQYRRFMFAPVSFLPYLRIPVNVSWALSFDALVERLRVMNMLFVNQAMVARRD